MNSCALAAASTTVPAGPEAFLRALYQRHGAVALRFAARLLGGDWHRAEDVLQEAAIRAWQHAAELDPAAVGMRSWLFTVMRRLVIDGYRAQQARPLEAGEVDAARLPVDDGVDQVLTAQVVVEAMGDLAPMQREVLVQVYYLGRTVTQAAEVMGVPPGTVKSRTYYAARALRKALRSRGVLSS